MIASGMYWSRGSSRRNLRERRASRHTRATIVVSQPPKFLTTLASVRRRQNGTHWHAESNRGQNFSRPRALIAAYGARTARSHIIPEPASSVGTLREQSMSRVSLKLYGRRAVVF
jgi:hypothetical protein